jgi:hypothetical protein
MAYPSTIDTPASFGTPAGISSITSPDHAASHTSLAVALGTVEAVIGTTSGTAIAKNITVGKFAVSDNGGTFNNGILGTPRITGGTASGWIVGTSTIQGGTANNVVINSGTLGTPTITGGSVAVSGTTTPLTIGAGLIPTVGTVTDTVAGTITVNAQASNIYMCALGTSAGNRTVGTPLNPTLGQSLTYGFKTSGSANGTLVWQGAFRFSQDIGTPALGTGVTWNYYAWRYNGIDSKWDFQGNSKNII